MKCVCRCVRVKGPLKGSFPSEILSGLRPLIPVMLWSCFYPFDKDHQNPTEAIKLLSYIGHGGE